MGLNAVTGVVARILTKVFGRRGLVAHGGFHGAVDAVNRLPRPLAALGCLGFFAYGALRPEAFRDWMGALATVPEPMWWLVTAGLGLHFGAREAHYLRARPQGTPEATPDQGA